MIPDLLNTPLALRPEAYHALTAKRPMSYGADDEDYLPSSSQSASSRQPVIDGVCVIKVRGVLLQRGSWAGLGYDELRSQFLQAIAEPSVKAIAFDIDSPGGEVAGLFDLVDTIAAARGVKPMWAICNEGAYSAAYALASAADVVCVPRSGGCGSVGVVAAHCDISKMLDQAGVKVTLIQYGERKADGNETQPLSSEAARRLQADVDAMGVLFIETVARNRGLTTAQVIATQALTYLGQAGVTVGFADAVMAPDEAFAVLRAGVGQP